jgi:hypothetical protein
MSRIIAATFVLLLLSNSPSAQPSPAECKQLQHELSQQIAAIKLLSTMTPEQKAALKFRAEKNLATAKQCLKIETDKLVEDLKKRGLLIEWQE